MQPLEYIEDLLSILCIEANAIIGKSKLMIAGYREGFGYVFYGFLPCAGQG